MSSITNVNGLFVSSVGEKHTRLKVRKEDDQTTSIGAYLEGNMKIKLSSFLQENVDVFTWKPTKMPGINPNFFCHKLAGNHFVKLVFQRRRKMTSQLLD